MSSRRPVPRFLLSHARACAWAALGIAFGVGCREHGFTKFNNEPKANIRSPTAATSVDRDVPFTAQGSVSDVDHDTEDLVVRWFADGELVCEGPADSDGNTVCDIVLPEMEGEIVLEVTDPGDATGKDSVNLNTRLDLDPTVQIYSPSSDSYYYVDLAVSFLGEVLDTEDAPEALIVSVTSDADGDLSVTVLPDGKVTGSFNLSRGDHVISMVAEDTAGHAESAAAFIHVGPQNRTPDCAIISPDSGAAFNPSDVIMLSAEATDKDVPASMLTVLWQSTVDGVLGVTEPNTDGETVLPLEDLTAATHSISINVTDDVGAECTDQIIITVGEPPSLNIVSPVDGGVYETGEPVPFYAEIGDGEDGPDVLNVIWESSLDGEVSTQGADSTGIAEFSLDGLTPGTHVLLVSVEDSGGLFVTDSVTFYINGVPSAPEVLVTDNDDTDCSGDPVTSSDTLRACVTADSVDPDGEVVSYEYAWYVDGVIDLAYTGATVDSEHTSRGESWRVVVTPNDGLSDGTSAWDQTTVLNSAPLIESLIIEPESPATTDDLVCTVALATDADDDVINYSYGWSINDAIVGVVTSVLSADFVEQGDRVSCNATPSDGLVIGATATSDSVTVGNSIPVVETATITPSEATAGDPLTCSYTGWSDADADDVDMSVINWFVDGVDTGVSGGVISSGYVVDNVVTCTVTPYDGEDYGTPVTDSILILNSPPTVDNVRIDPDVATGIDELTCVWEGYVDIDGDPDVSVATWSINGVFATSGTTLSEGFVGGDDVACVVTPHDGRDPGPPLSTTITITNSSPSVESASVTPIDPVYGTEVTCAWTGFFDLDDDADVSLVSWTVDGVEVGTEATISSGFDGADTLVCTVTPFDGVTTGDPVTASVLVGNTAPSIGGVAIVPPDPTPGDTVTCEWYDYLDVDGDPDQTTVEWTLDGEVIGTEVDRLIDFETGSTLSCTVTPYDGIDSGSPVSTSVTVSNRIPTIDTVTITPSPAFASDTLTCAWEGFSDADGDPDLSYLEWRVGDMVMGTSPTLSGVFLGGDIVLCTVTPYDGKDAGVAKVQAIVVSNTPPSLDSALITPAVPYRSDDLVCSWSGYADADGDPDASTVQWYINGVPVATGATLPAHVASEEDAVTCEVTAHDGIDAGNVVIGSVEVQVSIPSIAEVAISPDPAYTNTALTCAWSGFVDADDDPDLSGSTVTWSIGGVEVGTGVGLSDVYAIDDVVTCIVIPYDGMHYGTPVVASTTILNSPPDIESVSLTPLEVYEGDVLTCTPGVTIDIDGVTVFTYNYAWEVDGTRIAPATVTLDSTDFNRDQEVVCYASASDGTSYGPETASNGVTVRNSPPQIVTADLTPTTIYTNDTVGVDLVTYDADGDTIVTGYAWYVNSSVVAATGETLSGLAFFERDDTLSVTLTPFDGTDLGGLVSSAVITVQNTPPDAPGISVTPPEPVAFVDDTLCQVDTDSTDADGDSVVYTLGWTRDGGAFSGGTTTTLSGDTISADDIRAYESWTCTIVPNDGTENGSPGIATVDIESIFAGWPDVDVGLEDADITFVGDNLGDYLGRSVDFVGDVDGDNRDDILMVAPQNDDGGIGAGRGYLFLAAGLGAYELVPASAADHLWFGEGDNSALGGDYTLSSRAMSGVGDANGDGLGDFVLGSPGYSATSSSEEGRAYLFLGGLLGDEGDYSVNDAHVGDSAPFEQYIFTGEDGDELGHSVAGAGDVDGDTKDDILLGAPYYSSNTGRAYLVSSLDLGPSHALDLPADADHVFYGEAPGDYAGIRAVGVGDVDGDGRSDLLIGASNNDELASSAGRSYLVFSSSLSTKSFDLDDADRFLNGTTSNDLSGRQLAAAGDVDKDGTADFLVAATGLDPDGRSNAGGVFLFSGASLSPFANIDLDASDWLLQGESAGDKAGSDVDSAGDVDGDGRGDILIGAPNNDAGGSSTGRSYLVLGYFLPSSGVVDLGTANYTFTGEYVSDTSGYAVGGGGDIDNDGLDDILVGSALSDGGGDEAGQVYLLVAPSVFD